MLSFFLYIWIASFTILTVILLTLLFSITSLFRVNTTFHHYILKFWAKSTLLFHQVEIIGKEHILENRSQIAFANHQGDLDIMLIYLIFDFPMTWLAKASLFDVPFFGWVLKKLGHIPVYRGNKTKTPITISTSIDKLKSGTSIAIFPEGTWSDSTKTLLPFKDGLHMLSSNSHVPLLPVVIIGSNQVHPPDTNKFKLGKMKVIIHPPIYSQDYMDLEKNDFLEKMKSVLEKTLLN